ncbi:hypothetical protein BJF79_22950 [Actinomadura sp. CNU-125]|uniref:PucR family transcriptional regulator n=1 Tax=Actinomadura sp. CNU-125 TaxID=1904961 RepID=UPI0009657D1E|nr:helix-turn-helix domain-containing protein [Actinomadura sp. CNU-125]OLT12135.1 hypothetical protein BJF79_22950 [Actinomadura sp. CNU-125]
MSLSLSIPPPEAFTWIPDFQRGLGDLLRPHVESVTDEIAEEVRGHVPADVRPVAGRSGCELIRMIGGTVRAFVDSVDDPAHDPAPLDGAYRLLGSREARRGRGLDGLEAALRLGGQIACRRLIRQAHGLDWPRDVLATLTERLFQFVDRLVDSAAEGHAAARQDLTTERERRRGTLRDALVTDPPASGEAIAELARAAGWAVPETICVIVPHATGAAGVTRRLVPPTVLADWSGDLPYLIVPDPAGPGQDTLLADLVKHHPGAVGPAVPLRSGAVSMRWARRAAALIRQGALPGTGAVRCVDHLPTLTAHAGRELVDATVAHYLGPLLEQPSPRREMLAETLLCYLNNADNAVTTAEELHLHAQTVRYRVRVIQDLFGGELPGPRTRLATMIALNALLRLPGIAAPGGKGQERGGSAPRWP